jgi:hypothetical protein
LQGSFKTTLRKRFFAKRNGRNAKWEALSIQAGLLGKELTGHDRAP